MAPRLLALLTAGAVAGFLLAPQAAHGATVCAHRALFVDQLREQHNEMVVAEGLAANGSVLEILTSPEGETWTIIISTPRGFSCVIAVGSHYETVKARKQKGGGKPL